MRALSQDYPNVRELMYSVPGTHLMGDGFPVFVQLLQFTHTHETRIAAFQEGLSRPSK